MSHISPHLMENEIQWQLIPVRKCTMVANRYGHGSFGFRNTLTGSDDVFVIGGNHKEDLAGKFSIAKLQLYRHLQDGSVVEAGYHRQMVHHASESDKRFPRWGFAYAYCEEEQRFFMHGGFDTLNDHSDTRFFSPEHRSCSTLGSDGGGPSPRGYHSATYVPKKSNRKLQSNMVITFGGQTCLGGPYMYFNDVHALDLESLNWTHWRCEGDVPSARSQTFAFTWRGQMYVYGGYNGRKLFTDLFKLDLLTQQWTRLMTTGDHPNTLSGLVPKNFRIFPCKPCGLLVGNKLILVLEDYATSTMDAYVLHLRSMRWIQLKGYSSHGTVPQEDVLLPVDEPFNPPARGNGTLVRSGEHLYVIGGTERHLSKTKCPAPHLWQLTLPRAMSWDRERILWLACFKNNPWDCHLARCPPHIIYYIITLVNTNSFNLKSWM
ncbi:hypothetical protein TCAL_02508 [Tigriopus californicus]|uniref:Kelch domain-containing protein n=1 Tax=Tigriopus californicus TaxID=6832 RepID=A0A553NSK7_TIGCA|nr:kelch domain-containing protein 3-like [Tigriopus californicus]TRY68422.1 hypothetical protein TCAL_02508 [Tigriopus californicus]